MKTILEERLIQTEAEAVNWKEAVRSAGELLVKNGFTSDTFIDDMIATVEKFGPYMILLPDVAFFHGPPSKRVLKNGLALITLKQDVYFDEFDHQRIRCAFAFGAVDNESHMELLQGVVALLQDEEFVYLITHHGTKEAILSCIENIEKGKEVL